MINAPISRAATKKIKNDRSVENNEEYENILQIAERRKSFAVVVRRVERNVVINAGDFNAWSRMKYTIG